MNALDRFRWDILGDLVFEGMCGVWDVLEAARSEFVGSSDELAEIASASILQLIRTGTTYAFRVEHLDDVNTAASDFAKRIDIEVISELSGKPVVEWVESRVWLSATEEGKKLCASPPEEVAVMWCLK